MINYVIWRKYSFLQPNTSFLLAKALVS